LEKIIGPRREKDKGGNSLGKEGRRRRCSPKKERKLFNRRSLLLFFFNIFSCAIDNREEGRLLAGASGGVAITPSASGQTALGRSLLVARFSADSGLVASPLGFAFLLGDLGAAFLAASLEEARLGAAGAKGTSIVALFVAIHGAISAEARAGRGGRGGHGA